jgi:hypothetical protein
MTSCLNYQADLLLNVKNVTIVNDDTLNSYFEEYPEKLSIKNDILNVFSDWVY